MPQITVVTPSVRKEALDIGYKCLSRQTISNFDWCVVSPFRYDACDEWIHDPPKKKGDYYSLNKAWNAAFRRVHSPLIVNIVDGIWFASDTLERLWYHYDKNPKACITTVGHQYDKLENGKPEHLIWKDPRARSDFGSFYEVTHREMELCLASFPTQAIIDVGGIDEEFDKYAALSEKEMMARIYNAGYKLYIDQSIEYRAIYHPRLSKEWDKKYQEGWTYYEKCMWEIEQGTRRRLTNINYKLNLLDKFYY